MIETMYAGAGIFFFVLFVIALHGLIMEGGIRETLNRKEKRMAAILALVFFGLMWFVAILQTQALMPGLGIATLAWKAIPFLTWFCITGLIFVVPVSLFLGIVFFLGHMLLAALFPERFTMFKEDK